MSHLIIKDIDQVFTPAGNRWSKTWHNLETQLENGITAESVKDCFCPIVQCGLKPDFETAVSTVPADLQSDCDLSQFKLIMADCRNGLSKAVHPLYVPKKGYVIHQNRALFDSMVAAANKVLGADRYEIVTVGTLGGYSQFFVSIAIKGDNEFSVGKLENGANDVWDKFFNLNSSHNGLIASNVMLSTVRIVCMNTVQMSISDAEQGGTISVIKHTQNSEELITPETFEANLNLWLSKSESFQAALAHCKAAPMQIDDFKAFAAGVFTNPKTDMLSTVSFNRIETMAGLFAKGQGNQGNSRYDAINAFTEFFTHGDADTTMSTAKRVAMANFGRGNDWKQEAMAVATDETLFSETVKRGTLLYSDKLAANAAGN
jgi:hypothetical protein